MTLDVKASLAKPLKWGILAGLLMALGSLFLPNYYRSEARFLPAESKGLGNLGGLASAAAAFGVTVPTGEGGDANFVDILNSRSLRQHLLQTEFQYHIRSWRFGPERLVRHKLSEYVDEANPSRALKKLSEIISASKDTKSRVITLSAETKSPELSQQLVQQAGAYLEAFLKEQGRTRGGAKAAFAEARLREARGEMDEAEDAWRRFLQANRNYQSIADPAVRLKGARLENELRLRQQLVTTLALNREQALLEEKNDIPVLNIMDPADLPTEKSKPSRAVLVVLVTLVVALASWVWLNRDWVRARMLDEDEPESPAKEHS